MNFVTIAAFATPEEAEAAQLALQAEGIECNLVNEAVVGMLWYLGNAVGGVQVQVPISEAGRARRILAGSRKELSGTAADQEIRCPKCGAQLPAGFEVCWQCETPVEDTAGDNETPGTARPEADEEEPSEVFAGDAAASCAWRAAIIGLFACPPLLHFYSVWTLIKLSLAGQPLSRQGTRKFYAALAVDLIVCAIGGLAPLIAMLWFNWFGPNVSSTLVH